MGHTASRRALHCIVPQIFCERGRLQELRDYKVEQSPFNFHSLALQQSMPQKSLCVRTLCHATWLRMKRYRNKAQLLKLDEDGDGHLTLAQIQTWLCQVAGECQHLKARPFSVFAIEKGGIALSCRHHVRRTFGGMQMTTDGRFQQACDRSGKSLRHARFSSC
jgi:hypothetical protein